MKCRLLVLGGPRSFKVQNVVSIPEKQTFDTFHNNNIRFTTIITCIAITAPWTFYPSTFTFALKSKAKHKNVTPEGP